MSRKVCGFVAALLLASLFAPEGAADNPAARLVKRDDSAVSLELTFSKRRMSTLERVLSALDEGPNGHATGFVVGDNLVMTAYHVVSGNLSAPKKAALGFGRNDQLDVRVSIAGCAADVLKVDKDADLALLRVCHTPRNERAPAFQSSLSQDETLFVVARPDGDRTVRQGVFNGPYTLRGQPFLSARLEGRDGYSGSPVYNQRAEIVGVFCGYDSSNQLALISPGEKAQKLLADYTDGLKR